MKAPFSGRARCPAKSSTYAWPQPDNVSSVAAYETQAKTKYGTLMRLMRAVAAFVVFEAEPAEVGTEGQI